MAEGALVLSPERKQSNAILAEWCAPITGDVLSIGSGGDIDKQGKTYRQYFSSASRYVTSDLNAAMGADVVLDARAMTPIQASSFDAVFCSGVLEHIDDCVAAVAEVWRVLKAGGLFIVGVPFKQPIHRAPGDFWRFTEYGVRWLLRAFRIDEIRPLGDPAFPFGYWVKAVKP